jgi:TonB family protein
MNAMTGDTTASNAIAAEPETSSAAAANSGTVTVKKSIALKHPVIAKDNDGVYSHAEVDPVFPGGQIALDKYFDNNIKFPKAAVNAGRVARVVVSFVVDENGAVSDVKDIGRKAGYGFDEEAVRVVYNMPKWAPGTVGGKPVKTRMTLPVFFRPKK